MSKRRRRSTIEYHAAPIDQLIQLSHDYNFVQQLFYQIRCNQTDSVGPTVSVTCYHFAQHIMDDYSYKQLPIIRASGETITQKKTDPLKILLPYQQQLSQSISNEFSSILERPITPEISLTIGDEIRQGHAQHHAYYWRVNIYHMENIWPAYQAQKSLSFSQAEQANHTIQTVLGPRHQKHWQDAIAPHVSQYIAGFR
jgi:hypothetical protein